MPKFGSYIIGVLKKYNVEPVIFLYMLARHMYMPTATNQLITDKLCMNQYHQSGNFCLFINEDEFKDTQNATAILGTTVSYMMYGQMILSIPSIFATIFLGPFLDMYAIAPKVVLISCILSGMFESSILLFNVIFFEVHSAFILTSHVLNGLTGGQMLCMTAVFTFAMKETPLEERTFRFTIIELFLVIANPIASYLSAIILPLEPWLIEGEIRNYVPIFLISICCYVINLIFVAFVLGEVKEASNPSDSVLKRASLRTSLQPMSTEYLECRIREVELPPMQYVNKAFDDDDQKEFKLNLEKSNREDPNNNNYLGSELKEQRSLSFHQSLPVLNTKNVTKREMAKSLFQTKNAVSMMKGVIKRRPEKRHLLLWLIISIYIIMLVCSNAIPLIMLSFAQKVYGMETDLFLEMESYGHLISGLTSTFLLSFLHKIELKDTITIIIGLLSLCSVNLCRGLILQPKGMYISYLTGSVYLCAVVACRGLCSKIVPEHEIGAIMGALSVFYAISPVIGSILYSQIFQYSLSIHFPGLAFIVGACLSSVAILLAIYLHIRYTHIRRQDFYNFLRKCVCLKPIDTQ